MKAYPYNPQFNQEHNGMDLRDYFAGQVIEGLLADGGWGGDLSYFEDVAEGAYRMADAMMKAREK
jgi:hypothetical protein